MFKVSKAEEPHEFIPHLSKTTKLLRTFDMGCVSVPVSLLFEKEAKMGLIPCCLDLDQYTCLQEIAEVMS